MENTSGGLTNIPGIRALEPRGSQVAQLVGGKAGNAGESQKKRAEELRWGRPCPAQPSHTFGQATLWGLWPRSPSRTQTPPQRPPKTPLTLLSTTGGTQAVWVQFLEIPGMINFAGGKRQQNSPLENSQPCWEHVMGSRSGHCPLTWAPRSPDKISELC